MSNEERI